MKRREFITLLSGAAAWPLTAHAQQTGRVWRVAVIGAVSPLPAMLSAFREALQQRGWTEGKNLSIDVRWPKGSFAQEPGLISEVLHSNVDVIVAWARARRVHPVIVGWSTPNRPLIPSPSMMIPLPHGLGQLPGETGSYWTYSSAPDGGTD